MTTVERSDDPVHHHILIIAGHLVVEPADRDAYVAECAPIVETARAAIGCLDFSITADSVDPARISIYELWESEDRLLAFRGSGPSSDQKTRILDASVKRYAISSVEEP
ncbi:MAG: antibiotic biosynthesis monooxygenase family protein [Rubrobacteraceae bacterium]